MRQNSAEINDVWIRWDWLWSTIFYGAIAISAVLTVLDPDAGNLALILLLTLLWIAWHWGGMRLGNRGEDFWEEKAFLRLFVLLGDIVFWFVLVSLSPNYYIALFGLFGQIFRHLPIRYAIVTTIVLIGAISFKQVADEGQTLSLSDPLLWVYLLMGMAFILLGVWISAIIGQSTRRRELIEQLEATQAQLAAAERREGMLEERQRLAREIHDTLAQGFTSIVMHLEAAEQALPDQLDVLQTHLNQARKTARSSLEQARRVVQDLRPELLEQHALPEAIGRAAERWSEESGIPVEVTITGDICPLHPDIEVTLLRAAQEALNNVRKHANASEVCLTLSYIEDVIILDVQDNGAGLEEPLPAPLSSGYGLQAMRERVGQFGGEVLLESDPGEGTTLVVSVPVSVKA